MDLSLTFDVIHQEKGEKFIFLIDEWDSIFRYRKGETKEQENFLGFLKDLFKDRSFIELVYMTGILPIKKYNTGSALNMFREYTIIDPKSLGSFFGFTKEELSLLCEKNQNLSKEELTEWYNGYYLEGVGNIYNPKSVVEALSEGICKDYWNKTGGFTELKESFLFQSHPIILFHICLLHPFPSRTILPQSKLRQHPRRCMPGALCQALRPFVVGRYRRENHRPHLA